MTLPTKRHTTHILSCAQVASKINDLTLQISRDNDVASNEEPMLFCGKIASDQYHIPTVYIDATNKVVFANTSAFMSVMLNVCGQKSDILYNVETRSFVVNTSPSSADRTYTHPLSELLDNRVFFKLMKGWDRDVITQEHVDHVSEVLTRINDLEVLVVFNGGMAREDFITRFNKS